MKQVISSSILALSLMTHGVAAQDVSQSQITEATIATQSVEASGSMLVPMLMLVVMLVAVSSGPSSGYGSLS